MLAGLALILFPLFGLALKFVYPGWMLVLAVWSSPVLLAGYIVQIVIAVHGLLRSRGVLRRESAGRRGVIAAWVTSIGILGVGFLLVDGGDDGRWGSAFTELFGLSMTTQGDDVSTVLCLLAGFLWLAGWLWLVVEWIVQLVVARRARPAA